MKRGGRLLMLLAVTAVLIGLIVFLKSGGADGTEPEAGDDTMELIALDPETVNELRWTYEGEECVFVKKDGKWKLASDDAFPVDLTYINAMLQTLSSVSATRRIEGGAALSEYGLDAPFLTVRASAGDTVELQFGDQTGISGDYYCTAGDGGVYLVPYETAAAFSHGVMDLVFKEVLPEANLIRSFKVTSPEREYTIEQEEGPEADTYIYYLNENGGRELLDTGKAESFLKTVSALTWGDCVEYKCGEDGLAAYGLAEPLVKVDMVYSPGSVKNSDGSVHTFADTDFSIEFGQADGTDYSRIAGSHMVYTVNDVCDKLLNMQLSDLQAAAE